MYEQFDCHLPGRGGFTEYFLAKIKIYSGIKISKIGCTAENVTLAFLHLKCVCLIWRRIYNCKFVEIIGKRELKITPPTPSGKVDFIY